MRHAQGFVAHEAFRIGGKPLLDTDELYFDGNSEGAILGGALCAVARDFRRCVLGEAGHDPHDDTPQIPAVQALKDAFWHPAGAVIDVCDGAPCTGEQY